MNSLHFVECPYAVQDDAGNARVGDMIEIRDRATNTLIPLFTDSTGGTPDSNPKAVDAHGELLVFALPGRYKLVNTTHAGTRDWDAGIPIPLQLFSASASDPVLETGIVGASDLSLRLEADGSLHWGLGGSGSGVQLFQDLELAPNGAGLGVYQDQGSGMDPTFTLYDHRFNPFTFSGTGTWNEMGTSYLSIANANGNANLQMQQVESAGPKFSPNIYMQRDNGAPNSLILQTHEYNRPSVPYFGIDFKGNIGWDFDANVGPAPGTPETALFQDSVIGRRALAMWSGASHIGTTPGIGFEESTFTVYGRDFNPYTGTPASVGNSYGTWLRLKPWRLEINTPDQGSDSLVKLSLIDTAGKFSGSLLLSADAALPGTANDAIYVTNTDGEDIFIMDYNGKMSWGPHGPGTPADTFMQRAAAGVMSMPRIRTVAADEATTAVAGTNGAPPAQVKGYIIAQDHTGTNIKIPYYAN